VNDDRALSRCSFPGGRASVLTSHAREPQARNTMHDIAFVPAYLRYGHRLQLTRARLVRTLALPGYLPRVLAYPFGP